MVDNMTSIVYYVYEVTSFSRQMPKENTAACTAVVLAKRMRHRSEAEMEGNRNMVVNREKYTGNKTFYLVITALFAAVIAVASWITVPLPFTPIPINLATLAVTLTGALLRYKYGTFSVIVYLLLGAVGVPVFAGFTGGLGHIAGPTGGYLVGYVTSALICGLAIEFLGKNETKWWVTLTAAFLGTLSCYILGTIWFIVLTHNTLAAAMTMCVIPFLPGEVFKLIASVVIVSALKPALDRMMQAA